MTARPRVPGRGGPGLVLTALALAAAVTLPLAGPGPGQAQEASGSPAAPAPDAAAPPHRSLPPAATGQPPSVAPAEARPTPGAAPATGRPASGEAAASAPPRQGAAPPPRPRRRPSNLSRPPQPIEPLGPRVATPKQRPPALDLAPVPDRNLEGPPRIAGQEGPSLQPSIIQRRLPNHGAAGDGSPSRTEERLFTPAPGARLTVPFSY